MAIRVVVLAAATVIALGGCDRGAGRLPPGGIAGLDGVYAGEAALTWGRQICAARAPYRMTVRNGTVYGEARDPRDPAAVIGRFETFVDSEGRIGTTARVAGNEVRVEGFFDRDRFDGTTQSNDCRTRLTLRKDRGA